MALTDSKLRALNGKKHNKAPIKLADRDGLYIYHRKTGTLSFVYRYRYDGKPQDLALGTYPVMSLAKAREQVVECRAILADGYDPKVQRQLIKDSQLQAVTVQDALEYWLENYAAKNRANHEKHRAQFNRHVIPFIGHLPLEQCETRHWVKVFDDISNGTHYRAAPKAAGYILQNCKQALRYCRVRRFAVSNALDDLTIADVGEHQNKRDRVLSWSELMDVWYWVQDTKHNWYYRKLVHLLVVFGARTQEVRLSTIDEWDLDAELWTVPKANSKTDTQIVRPIPGELKPLIKSLIEQSDTDYLLGELKRPEAVSCWGGSLGKKLGHNKSWTLHDLRRTFATLLNDMEVEPYVVEQLLGHSLGGVMAIYNRSQHIEKKRVALERWMKQLTNCESGNVINLRQA